MSEERRLALQKFVDESQLNPAIPFFSKNRREPEGLAYLNSSLGALMRFFAIFLIMIGCEPWLLGQQPEQVRPASQQPPASTASSTPQPQPGEAPKSSQAPPPQTEQVVAPATSPAPPATLASEAGYMEPAQVAALLHKIYLAAYRISDLLTVLHPEHWSLDDAARNSFNQTLQTLGAQLGELDKWRSQFEKRTDSMYLAYQTYLAINAVLPRIDAVAHIITQYENPTLGAQYSQPGNQILGLQQSLISYIDYLLRNQDQMLHALETNLAACQNTLGYAMRGRTEPATPMKNVIPVFKGLRRSPRATGTDGGAETGQKLEKKRQKAQGAPTK